MKARDKLRVYWHKREGLMGWHPVGSQTKCDLAYLFGIITPEVLAELERRGYNPKTLRISIEPQKDNPRFASQRQEG